METQVLGDVTLTRKEFDVLINLILLSGVSFAAKIVSCNFWIDTWFEVKTF